jgi:hypothetical protein
LQGTDITEAFESHHFTTTAPLLLNHFYVKQASAPRNSPYTFHVVIYIISPLWSAYYIVLLVFISSTVLCATIYKNLIKASHFKSFHDMFRPKWLSSGVKICGWGNFFLRWCSVVDIWFPPSAHVCIPPCVMFPVVLCSLSCLPLVRVCVFLLVMLCSPRIMFPILFSTFQTLKTLSEKCNRMLQSSN